MRIDPKKFKGSFEPQVYKALKYFRNMFKFKMEYESEQLPYTLHRKYNPDFIIKLKDGRKIYIEVKGYLRSDDRAKLLAVKRDNPDIDLRIVFQKNNKLNKRSRTYYSDWAERHDLPFAIGEIPKEWFK